LNFLKGPILVHCVSILFCVLFIWIISSS